MSDGADGIAAGLTNLLVPGGGLILLGRPATGTVISLLFAASANAVIATTLLFPDDFSRWTGGLAIGIACGTYLGAQVKLAQTVRERRDRRARAFRRQVLAAVCDCLKRGEPAQAQAALRPLEHEAQRDLLIAVRMAQVLTAKRDVPTARAAWQRVADLDRHHIYRREIDKNMRHLRDVSDSQVDAGTLRASDA